ncbi:MAG: DUF5667 domain-containing protein, partial [Candidatus Micrarchaeota archaeon]
MKYMVLLLALGLLAVPLFAEEVTTENEVTEGGSFGAETSEGETLEIAENASLETSTEINESEVGALPDDTFYGFKRFFENVDKFFTFDKSEKAKKHAKYGKLRAIEAHLMTKKAQAYGA